MTIDGALAQVRPITALIGTALIICALAKLAGIQIPIRADHWQLAILGLAARQV